MPRREEKKAASRQRILDSAREVFFRDGFMQAQDKFSFSAMAFEAGAIEPKISRFSIGKKVLSTEGR